MSLPAEPRRIYVVGTGDTKSEELAFLAGRITDLGGLATIIDLGTTPHETFGDIGLAELTAFAPPEA
ncbi:MAG: Tm-1-like ATP-binding domain-containing protein, partial [Mesorhizobium sp.]